MVCLNEVCMKGEKRKGEREFSIMVALMCVLFIALSCKCWELLLKMCMHNA